MGLVKFMQFQTYAYNRAKNINSKPEEYEHFFGGDVIAFEKKYQEEKKYWKYKIENEEREVMQKGFHEWKKEKELCNE